MVTQRPDSRRLGAKRRPRCRMGPPSAAEDSSGEPRAGVDPLKISPARQRRARGRIEQTLLDGDAAPTDPRPSLANRTIPHKSHRCFYLRQGPRHPEGYPGPVGYPTPEALPGSLLGELSHLIGYRDDVYAAVGHCLTYLVLHSGPMCESLCENHASNLFILERETHAADVCSWLVRVEAHHDGEVLTVLEQYVGGDNFEVLARGGVSRDAVALAHDARVGALLFLRYVVGRYIRRLLILRDFLLYWLKALSLLLLLNR